MISVDPVVANPITETPIISPDPKSGNPPENRSEKPPSFHYRPSPDHALTNRIRPESTPKSELSQEKWGVLATDPRVA
jgi:hypothetical protein